MAPSKSRGRPRKTVVDKYFTFDPITNYSICAVADCNEKIKSNHSGNLERHIRTRHPNVYVELDKKTSATTTIEGKVPVYEKGTTTVTEIKPELPPKFSCTPGTSVIIEPELPLKVPRTPGTSFELQDTVLPEYEKPATTFMIEPELPPKFPCPPGTSVTLGGTVWLESKGILVVNVTWRGQSYSGTLLVSEETSWVPSSSSDFPPNNGGKKTRGCPKRPTPVSRKSPHIIATNIIETRSSRSRKSNMIENVKSGTNFVDSKPSRASAPAQIVAPSLMLDNKTKNRSRPSESSGPSSNLGNKRKKFVPITAECSEPKTFSGISDTTPTPIECSTSSITLLLERKDHNPPAPKCLEPIDGLSTVISSPIPVKNSTLVKSEITQIHIMPLSPPESIEANDGFSFLKAQ